MVKGYESMVKDKLREKDAEIWSDNLVSDSYV